MALSPNYNWSEPDNSSLVKNGAQDIRALGDAIDTSVWNVGFGQAGKNKIINGDFGIWQRGTSFSNPASGSYTADRFDIIYNGTGSTRTISQQTFTSGTAPAAPYETQFFIRWDNTVAGTSNTTSYLRQNIEDVRTFAGQTITLSYWAKANASIAAYGVPTARQFFGSGGSSEVTTSFSGSAPTYTTAWQRFTYTVAVPSVSGKTIGSGSILRITIPLPVGVTFTADVWGVQVEAGSYATPFQTASGGSPQGELAMCQRYYENNYPTGRFPGANIGTPNPGDWGMHVVQVPVTGTAGANRGRAVAIPYKQTKRAQPTIRSWDGAGNLTKYTAADPNGSYISNNNALDAFGGFPNQSLQNIEWQTVAASATHIYCGLFWEASAEL